MTSHLSARAIKRLMSDLREIDSNPLPTVAAAPLPFDISTWHVNLRPSDGPFSGSVFHFRLRFPADYPASPPRVEMLSTGMPGHPNVFGDPSGGVFICLSMLKPYLKSVKYDGWTSAYSCMSLLLQLQSFLFADNIEQDNGDIEGPNREFDTAEWRLGVVRQVRANNRTFWIQLDDDLCHTHDAPWPPFADVQTLSTAPVPEVELCRRAAVASEQELVRELLYVDTLKQTMEELDSRVRQFGAASLSYKDAAMRSNRKAVSNKLAGRAELVARVVAAREARATAEMELQRNADEAARERGAQSVLLADLPTDILLAIADRLRTEDLPNLDRVCRSWRDLSLCHNLFARRQLCCFHSKERFSAPGVCLGVGLRLLEGHRSGELKDVATPFDLISEAAFTRDKVRLSVWKEPFTHFLPLAIDARHFSRSLPYLQRLTKQVFGERAKTTHLLDLLAAAMNSMVVQLFAATTDGTTPPLHASEVALDGYCAFHHLLLSCAERWPDIRAEADRRVRSFLASERGRHKDSTPDLGRLLVALTLSCKGWSALCYPFLREMLARNVRWVLQKKPFLASTRAQGRAQHTFEASLTGNRLVAFQIFFLNLVGRPASASGPHDVLASYERRLGKPTATQRAQLQAMAKRTLRLSNYRCAVRYL